MPYRSADEDYALTLANDSYEWYRQAAIKARKFHRATEVLQLVGSAAIPVSVAVSPENATVPAILGSMVVVITGLRAAFHWHEDYLRFSQAREAVEAERRLYNTGTVPYNDMDTRGQVLAMAITRIEQKEMGSWLKIAAPHDQASHRS
ncbi:DUF4231 domain-containing protein [Nocardia cyriacigeorgica]|uniref:DUF4231 domain-containing protein n=1 Tax=Nocardia cyriacigeorgica TaxID=135487 RepID=UPI002458E858|nr:DUF4231 domain-containing protein [Nocardia cyriacigeorgica]